MDEARALYEQSMALDPDIFQTVFGWARMEETDRNFDARRRAAGRRRAACAGQSERPADARRPARPRRGATTQAVATARRRSSAERGGGLGPVEWSEKGRLLDRMGRHDEAFAAFVEAKRALRELSGHAYWPTRPRTLAGGWRASSPRAADDPAARQRARRRRPADLHRRLPALGHHDGRADADGASEDRGRRRAADHQRAHPADPAHAGQPARLSRGAGRSVARRPAARGSTTCATTTCSAPASSARSPKGAAWFTDKMPLNETHLGPDRPDLPARRRSSTLLRHPLDVVLSVFSNQLTHGFYCAYDLTSIARHYVLIMDLVEHYRREMQLNYLAGPLRGHRRGPGSEREADAGLHRRAVRPRAAWPSTRTAAMRAPPATPR